MSDKKKKKTAAVHRVHAVVVVSKGLVDLGLWTANDCTSRIITIFIQDPTIPEAESAHFLFQDLNFGLDRCDT